MPADDSSSPEAFASIEECAVLDVWVFGQVCAAGCCRAIMQKLHGRVYPDGESVLAWHLPSDPMRGDSMCSQDPRAGQRHQRLWMGWADATGD